MSDLPEPRIADVDRDRVSQHLRVAYGEGRISEGELEERLTTVYEARTASELNVVVADLPVPPITVTPSMPARAKPQRSISVRPAIPLLVPPVVCTLVYLMTIPGNYFWPMWVWLGCGVPAVLAVIFATDSDDDDDAPPLPPPAPPGIAQ